MSEPNTNSENQGSEGAPNGKPHERGSQQNDASADHRIPGREFGAGGQVDDGPDETAGAGTGGG
jgi:hypothetical protein